MQPLVTRPISWVDQAPVAARGTGTTSAPPSEVFAVLADHERWPEWFGNVMEVEVLGPATGVGARRRVTVPGLVVDEEFIVWDEGERWAFTATAARPALFRSLVEDCVLTARPDGGTDLSYTMYFEPKPLVAPLMRLGSGLLDRTIDAAMRGLAARAEGRA
jgi:uncharacterized protein YndB with AHSA1/START domain